MSPAQYLSSEYLKTTISLTYTGGNRGKGLSGYTLGFLVFQQHLEIFSNFFNSRRNKHLMEKVLVKIGVRTEL